MEVEEEGDYMTYRYTVTTRMTRELGWAASHFNVSSFVKDKVTRQCPHTKPFEEEGQPKRNRTGALLFTSLTPNRIYLL